MNMFDTVLSGDYIDRQGALRGDPVALEKAYTDSMTRFVVIYHGRCLIHTTRIAFLTSAQISAYAQGPEHCTFLGKLDDRYIFALAIDTDDEPDFGTEAQFVGLRAISTHLDAADAGLAAFAKAIVAWQDNHRHCGLCGMRNQVAEGGFIMACADKQCDHRSFPRLDPAVIVLVHNNERALLGRQKGWPERLFSTIAGFVEPGESLEDAIRREVAEETNINVGDSTYMASQPWPFPAALMIGFHARGISKDIKLNDGELAEARWVSREEIASGEILPPTRFSVAYHLVETWFDQQDGPTLAQLNLPESSLRTPRPVDRNE